MSKPMNPDLAKLLADKLPLAPRTPRNIKTRCRNCGTLFSQSGHFKSAQQLAKKAELARIDPELGKVCCECVDTVYDAIKPALAAIEPLPAGLSDDKLEDALAEDEEVQDARRHGGF